jgi:hypothetical protein
MKGGEEGFALQGVALMCCPAFALLGALLGNALGKLQGSPVECQLLLV